MGATTTTETTTQAASTGGAQLATRPLGPQAALKAELERIAPSLTTILPKHLTVDRLIKVVLSATARNTQLLACTRQSFVRAIMQAAEVGLELGGILGEAYLVPYNRSWKDEKGKWHKDREVQCIPGYRGLIKLARQSGQIKSIGARVVHERDVISIDLAAEHIEHRPCLVGDPGPLVAVYAIARFRDGGQQTDLMSRDDIEKIRRRSKTYNADTGASDGPWATDYNEMARKTVVRRLCKYLPLSSEMKRAMELEEEIDHEDRRELQISTPGAIVDAHFEPDALGDAPSLEAALADPPHDAVTGEVIETGGAA